MVNKEAHALLCSSQFSGADGKLNKDADRVTSMVKKQLRSLGLCPLMRVLKETLGRRDI